RLGDRLEESDLETAALQGADQPQADGGETDTETGGGDEEGMHELTSVEQGKGIEGYLPLFVGRHHQHAGVAVGVDGARDATHATGVGLRIEFQLEQAQVLE